MFRKDNFSEDSVRRGLLAFIVFMLLLLCFFGMVAAEVMVP